MQSMNIVIILVIMMKMTYNFVLQNNQWVWEITPESCGIFTQIELDEIIFKNYIQLFIYGYNYDINLFKLIKEQIFRQLNFGNTVYIRENGSWYINDDTVEITDRKIMTEFRFPTNTRITISRWPNGIHWYLSTKNSNRKFPKFKTIDDAISEALKYTTRSNIEIKYDRYIVV